uniref:Ribonuclease H-like domain-containing protein n=1 Tax=Tanacetum cinerariifolium TaxID=118510 RepID=A0A6L2N999_TANCI|nr:ribonuclease H-like domain-containing protein [Tanacetum cinerariifolium]
MDSRSTSWNSRRWRTQDDLLKKIKIKIRKRFSVLIQLEAVNTACYVQNRVLVVKPHNKTLYERFHGRTPALSFMRPFRCPFIILNTKDHLGKFDGKADEGFFVGYSLNSKAFRVFNSRTRIVEENLHIRFNENTPNIVGSGPDWLFDIDALTRTINYEPIVVDQEKEDNVNSTNNVNAAGTYRVNAVGANTNNELLFDPEMPALEDISTFNFSSDQEHDDEMADMNNLDTTIQMDVKGVFLYGKIKEEVYVCQPPGFEDPDFSNKVYKVKKALYGLHQAPKAWYETLSTYLLDNGFHRGKIDKTLFIKRNKGDILLVQVYVDDIIVGSTKKELCNVFKKMIHEKFQKVLWENLHSFWDVKNAITPMETQKTLLKDKDGEEVDVHMVVGSVKWDFPLVNRQAKDWECGYYVMKWMHDFIMKYQNDNFPNTHMRLSIRRDNSLEMADTTASSLEAELDSGNINKAQYKATLNEPSFVGTSSGVNTPRSDEDSLKLKELMELCTNLQNKVLDLENTKTTQALEIDTLKRRVKKFEKKQISRTHKLKRLYNVGSTARVDSSDEASLGEDVSKQGRIIDDIDADEGITLVDETAEKQGRFNDQEDAKMLFDAADDLRGEEVFISQEVHLKEVNAAVAITTTATIDDITFAKALMEIKSAKPKADKVVIQEPEQDTTTITLTTTNAITITAASIRPKAKGLVIHEQEQAPTLTISSQQPSHVKKLLRCYKLRLMRKKDLQERERARQEQEANIALIEIWDDIQARVDTDYQLAQRLRKKEQTTKKSSTKEYHVYLFEKMKGWKPKSLKNKSFANIQELFDKAMKRVNTFVDYRTKLVVEISKEAEGKVTEGSSKRAGEKLKQENAKKQKMEDDKEST